MIVIDASAANKLFLTDEEGYKEAKGILENHLQGKERILIPDLLFYEVANTLSTKSSVPLSKILSYFLKDLYSFKFEIFYPSEKYIKAVVRFAKKYKVTVYDASYAVLAKEKKCNLVTADDKFVKQINLPFVKYLGEYRRGKEHKNQTV